EGQQGRRHPRPQGDAGAEEDGAGHPHRGAGAEEPGLSACAAEASEPRRPPTRLFRLSTVPMPRPPVLLALLALVIAAPRAQEAPPPLTPADGWRTALTAGLALSQAAYANWQEGGVSTLAVTGTSAGTFERVIGRFKQRHDARIAFGLVRHDTLDVRKAEDAVRYAFALQYRARGALQPTLALDARTQLAPGYDYAPDSAAYPHLDVVPGRRLKVSDFAAPLLLTQTL